MTTSTSKEKRKAMSKRYDVWGHYIEFITKEGDKKGKCKYCPKKLFADPKKMAHHH